MPALVASGLGEHTGGGLFALGDGQLTTLGRISRTGLAASAGTDGR